MRNLLISFLFFAACDPEFVSCDWPYKSFDICMEKKNKADICIAVNEVYDEQ